MTITKTIDGNAEKKVPELSSKAALEAAARLHMEGKFKEAESAYCELIAMYPDHSIARNNLGLLYAQQGKTESAAEQYGKAIEIDPSRSMPYCNLGNLQAAAGKYDEAIESFQSAITRDVKNTIAWDCLAKVLFTLSRHDEALEAWQTALHYDPENAESHLSIACCFAECRKFDNAISHLQQAIALREDYEAAWVEMGIVLFAMHDYGSATKVLKRTLGIAPENLQARYHLSLSLALCGDRAGARCELERILLIDASHGGALTDLGVYAMEERNFEASFKYFHKAIEYNPNNYRARYHAALAYELTGKCETAQSMMKELAQIQNSDSHYPSRAREYLKQKGEDKNPVTGFDEKLQNKCMVRNTF